MYFKSKIVFALIACMAISGCSTTHNTSKSNSNPIAPDSDTIESSTLINGIARVPTSLLSEKLSLSSSEAETPLTGATVKVIDPLTGKIFTDVPATTTDSEGKFTLDISAIASQNSAVRFIVTSEFSDNEIIVLTRDEDENAFTSKTLNITQETTLITNTIEKTKLLTVANLLESATEIPSDKKLTLEDAYKGLLSAAKSLKITDLSSSPSLRATKPSSNVASLTDSEIQKVLAEQSIRNKTIIDSAIESNPAIETSVNTAKTTFETASISVAKTLNYPENMDFIDLGDTLSDPIELPSISFPEGTVFSRSVVLNSETTSLPTRATIKAGFNLPTDGSVTLGTGTQFKRGATIPTAYAKKLPTSVTIEKNVELPVGTKLPQGTTFEDNFELKSDRNFEYATGFVLPKNIDFSDGFVMPKGTDVSYEDGFIIPRNVTLPEDMVIPKEVLDFEGREIDNTIAEMFADDYVIKNELKSRFSSSLNITSELTNKLANDFIVDITIVEKFDDSLSIEQNLLDKFDTSVTLSETLLAKLDSSTRIKSQHLRKLERIDAEIATRFDTGVKIPNALKTRVSEINSDIAARFDTDFKIDNSLKDKITEIDTAVQSFLDENFTIDADTLEKVVSIDSDIASRLDDGIEIDESMKDKLSEITPEVANRFKDSFKIDNSLRNKITQINSDMKSKFDSELVLNDTLIELIPEGEEEDFNDFLPLERKHVTAQIIIDKIINNTLTESEFTRYYSQGKNLLATTEDGDTFLALAVKHGKPEMVELLANLKEDIPELRFNLTAPNNLGISIMDFLMNPTYASNYIKPTPIEIPVQTFYDDVIEALIEDRIISESTYQIEIDVTESPSVLEAALNSHDLSAYYDRTLTLLIQRKHVNADTVQEMLEPLSAFITDDMEDYNYLSFLGELSLHFKVLRDIDKFRQVGTIRITMHNLGF